jgi:hypothetical protein
MPKPHSNETKEDFTKRCIPQVMADGTAQDNEQAFAICNNIWQEEQAKNTKLQTGFDPNTNELNVNEPQWTEVDQNQLPQEAFAQNTSDNTAEWKYPHHYVLNGKIDKNTGRYASGKFFLHQSGLNNAYSQAVAAKARPEIVNHLKAHLESQMAEALKGIETVDLKEAHILSAGTWEASTGTVKVTEADIDEMIVNFNKRVIEPVLNLDHDDSMTEKVANGLKVVALGYVKSLRKEGKKLFASFTQVPIKVAEMINSGLIKQRSPEFFRSLRRGGVTWNNVLKAVSFFGRDIPAGMLDNYVDVFKATPTILQHDDDKCEVCVILNQNTEELNVEITQDKYEELVKAKNDAITVKSELETAVVELKVAKEKAVKLQAENERLEKEAEKINKLKADMEKEKADMLSKEATSYISKAIEDKKLLPKFKDAYVNDYVAKANDESALNLFKEDIESRGNVMANLEDLEHQVGSVNLKNLDYDNSDQVQAAISQLQAKEGLTFLEAADKLGCNV